MPYPLPLTRTEAYLAYKAGVIQQSDLKPSLAVPRNGIDAWLAYWTGLEADYPKNQDGTPMILQEEEAYIAYLCGVINEYPEKCLRRVGAYLRYLISARWGRPDHPLNREELYLSLIKTQFIPSGDPSSDIEIDGTAKAAFVDIKMYGDTFQQSYSGKNILNCVQRSGTSQGITCVISNTNTITVTGKSTTSYADLTDRVYTNITAGTFTFVVSQALTHRLTVRVYYDGGYDNAIIEPGDTYKTFTMASDITGFYVYMATGGTGITFNETFTVQIVAGSTPDYDFEPYVGGIASPNPDYPQPIQVVTGEQIVSKVGKNLFDKNHPNDSKCYVNNRGVLTSGGNQNLSVYIKCEPNTTYTVSKSNKGTNNRFCVFDTEVEPAIGGTVISTVGTRSGEDNNTSYTITTSANAHYLGVFYRAAATTPSESEIKDTVQIEKGSTATAYAPYSKHTYPINLGKNLLSAGLEVGGWLIGVGSTIEKTTNNNAYRCNAPISVKPNTEYIFSINGEAFDSFRVVYANAAGVILSNEVFTGTIKTPDNCYQIVFYSSAMKTAYPNIEDIKAQLEVGNTVTSYAEYFTPIELCKLGNYQDYIWKDGDSWKVHKAIDGLTLNGTEDWVKTNSGTSNWYYQVTGLTQNTPGEGKGYIISTHYAGAKVYNTNTNEGICATKTSKSLRIRYGSEDTTSNFKAWLSSNNVSLYYVLDTPTDTTITDQTLIAQLEALVKGGSEEGTTYIKLSTPEPNLPGLLYVEAAKYVE